MLIHKLKSSLTFKVFLITFVILVIACLLTYNFIAYYTPKAYSNELTNHLTENIKDLINELEHCIIEEAPALLERFAVNNQADILVLDSASNLVTLPGKEEEIVLEYFYLGTQSEAQNNVDIISVEQQNNNSNSEVTTDITISEGMRDSLTINQDFCFAGSDELYTLVVSGSRKAINQTAQALSKCLPLLIISILIISLVSSFCYSYYITRPIIQISRISKKMAQLEFNWYCDNKRSDEIGILATSLNELSGKLNTTLKELKTANLSLQADINLEKELEQKRLAFFSAVSHELKTPITIIKGQLEGMIYNIGVYQDNKKYLRRALNITNNIEDLVQEILTISRIESSGFTLHLEFFSINDLLKQCLSEQEDFFINKSLQVSTNIEEDLMINADKKLLHKVFNNLISNAIHYSPENHFIFLKLGKSQDGIQFIIENTGIHIPEEAISQLFEAFYRVEQSRNRSTGGSGLGLYITKMILDLHQTNYKIENTAAGVQFTFTIV